MDIGAPGTLPEQRAFRHMVTSQALKFCTQNFFPEDSSTIAEWAAAKPTFAAAWHSVSGAANVMAEARLTIKLFRDHLCLPDRWQGHMVLVVVERNV